MLREKKKGNDRVDVDNAGPERIEKKKKHERDGDERSHFKPLTKLSTSRDFKRIKYWLILLKKIPIIWFFFPKKNLPCRGCYCSRRTAFFFSLSFFFFYSLVFFNTNCIILLYASPPQNSTLAFNPHDTNLPPPDSFLFL